MTTDSNINSLISRLSEELQPIKKRSPYRNIAIWGVLSLVYIIGVIIYYGPTMDLSKKIVDAEFIFEMTMALGIFGFGALASSYLSFPDERQNIWARYTAVILFSVLMIWIFANIIEEGVSSSYFILGSCYKGVLVEAIPFAALIFLTVRGNSTKPYWLMTMNVFAVSSLGWIGLRITCAMYESMLYSFIHYLLPFIGLSLILGLFSRKIFKW